MDSRIATIARYTVLEALHARLVALALAAVVVLVATSLFIEALAITEGARFQAGFYAGAARFACVFIAGMYVLVSVTREFDDKGLDVLLALDLPRSHYVLGKLAGFLTIAAMLAAVAALPLAWLAPPQAALQWMLSLGLELAIVVALALFCIVTLQQLPAAACFVVGFYVLARSLTALRLMGEAPLSGTDALSHQVMRCLIEALALVMPAFESWTRTAWLVNQPASASDLLQLGGQSVLYVALLAGAAMFDFYRKNF